MKEYEKASTFVQKMKKRHGANPVWVWDILEEEYNTIKGHGHILDKDEQEHIEQLIIEGLK